MSKRNMDGLSLLYRPPPFARESILGYVDRSMYIGGLVRMKNLAETLVDRQTIQPPWSVPSNLTRLANNLEPVFSSGEQILHAHTCLPAYLPFVAQAHRPALMDHVLNGGRHRGIAAAVGLTGRAIQTKPRMAMCVECMHSDLETVGIAFWHREHTLAAGGFCPHHGTPTTTGCGGCRLSQIGSREPLMPRFECWCESPLAPCYPPVSTADAVVLTRLAQLAQTILEGALAGETPERIGMYYQFCAHRDGYAAGTRVKSPKLAAALSQAYSPAVFGRLNASFSRDQSWPQVTFGNGLAPNVLGRNLMLLDFFGQHVPTAAELAQAETFVGELEKAREEVSKKTSSRASRISSERVESDRAAIERYLEAHPGASRSQVLRELGKTAVRARDNDTAWYDLRLPARRRGMHLDDAGLEATLYLAYLDDRLSEHVRARHAKLSSFQGWAPKSITKTALLRGTPRANEVTNELLLKLPKTKAAIEECVETRDQFKRRLALTVLQQRSMPISKLVYDVRRRTNLSLREIHILNAELIGKNV